MGGVTSFIMGLQDLLKSGKQLPTLPVLVFQLHAALDRDNVSAREIVNLIERDPALTARLLRAANSAAFSRGPDRIADIGGAINRLGLNQVRSLCIVLSVVRAFGHEQQGLDHHRFWQHSAAVGLVAERLAHPGQGHSGSRGGDVYVAGLLHDVGLLILDQFFRTEFAEVQEEVTTELQASWRIEESRLGMDHGEIGGLFLGRWGLPPEVIAAVTHHHHPDSAPAEGAQLTRLVWAAEALCTATGLELPQEGVGEVSPGIAIEGLGIPTSEHESLLMEVGAIGERARHFLS